jgi:hypothetical protein
VNPIARYSIHGRRQGVGERERPLLGKSLTVKIRDVCENALPFKILGTTMVFPPKFRAKPNIGSVGRFFHIKLMSK